MWKRVPQVGVSMGESDERRGFRKLADATEAQIEGA